MDRSKVILAVGGSGYVGHSVVARLVAAGYRVRVPTRHRHRARHLLLLPTVEVIDADVFDDGVLSGLMANVDAVINLVGVLHSRPGTPYGPAFERAHVLLPARLVAACQRHGVRRLVHVSALGADAQGPSEYQRSKAAGEAVIRNAQPSLDWTILRPSVIFGQDDSFLNLFAGLLRVAPVMPLGGAACRFQPVWVEDVAKVVVACLERADAIGLTCDLAGPGVYTLADLVRYVGQLVGHRPPIIPIPEGLAMLQARVLELAPNPMMSRDNVRSMRVDNITAGPPLPFDLTPTALEAVAPGYLGPHPGRRRFFVNQRRAVR
ncbi:complex I NDUFA9 subunit family protein [Zoogloeaceae bacterium G21618-S1]|nr:complex I NDUFA9 subunit family protein [Zoogloeaceae bacterium G21618-S1]